VRKSYESEVSRLSNFGGGPRKKEDIKLQEGELIDDLGRVFEAMLSPWEGKVSLGKESPEICSGHSNPIGQSERLLERGVFRFMKGGASTKEYALSRLTIYFQGRGASIWTQLDRKEKGLKGAGGMSAGLIEIPKEKLKGREAHKYSTQEKKDCKRIYSNEKVQAEAAGGGGYDRLAG